MTDLLDDARTAIEQLQWRKDYVQASVVERLAAEIRDLRASVVELRSSIEPIATERDALRAEVAALRLGRYG